MPRPPRLHVPGGHYHVVLRGNHREALFTDAADRYALDEIVANELARFEARIHAFCWMSNHLHALIQIADQPLGKIMQRIAMRYSRYRHRRLDILGHLFERRYKAKLIEIDAYFLAVLRYIHLNPVKAHIVARPSEYPWCSHHAYLGLESISWLTTDFGLSLFSTDLSCARAAYQQFVTPGLGNENAMESIEANPHDSRILGCDKFLSSLSSPPLTPRSTCTLEQLAIRICSTRQVTNEELRSTCRARRLAAIRAEFARKAIEEHIASLTQVARFLNRDPSALSKLLARHS